VKGVIGLPRRECTRAADVTQTAVAHHRSGKQAPLEKNLEAVANAQDHGRRYWQIFEGFITGESARWRPCAGITMERTHLAE